MDWKSIVDTIPTKYPELLQKINYNTKSLAAVAKFSDEAKQMTADKFDKFVKRWGEKKVKRRGTMRAGFNQLPAEITEPTEREPQNESFTIDCRAQFGENLGTSSTIDQDVSTAIQNYISQRKSSLQQQYPDASSIDIGLVNYKITATTSKVPSADPGNKVLAEQRYNSMKRAFVAAANKLKIPGAPGEELKAVKGESGPEYVKDDAKYGPKGNRNDTYEKTFGPHRQSYITFTVDILIEFPPEPGEEGEGAKQERIRFYLKSRKFNFRLRLPSIRLGLPKLKMFGVKVPKPGVCPAFTERTGKKSRLKPGIKTPMGFM